MTARHARADDEPVTPALRLVDADPYEAVPPEAAFSPEVRAVLDAVASLHSALISWAATTAGTDPARHVATGRHRR